MENNQTPAAEITLLTISEKRAILATIIRGQRKAKRHIKVKDQIVELEEDLTTTQLLRAISLDEKLAKQQRVAEKQAAPPATPATEQTEAQKEITVTTNTETTTTTPLPAKRPSQSFAATPKPLSKKQLKKMAQRVVTPA